MWSPREIPRSGLEPADARGGRCPHRRPPGGSSGALRASRPGGAASGPRGPRRHMAAVSGAGAGAYRGRVEGERGRGRTEMPEGLGLLGLSGAS